MKQKKIFKKIMISLLSIIGILLLIVGSYVAYVAIQYYRIEDNLDLTNDIYRSNTSLDAKDIDSSTELSILTYNIGFGAYNRDYDFFLDEGYMLDGTHVQGTHSRALSYDWAKTNTEGSINTVFNENVDFVTIQEIDVNAHRSYKINQYEEFLNKLNGYEGVYSSNFHTAYLMYPPTYPIGKSESGLATFSRYKIDKCTRKSYPVDKSFPTKLFDLDRCFSVSRYTLSNGKELVIGNSHMSAYDKGGVIRAKQLTYLSEFLAEEKNKGNYVIIGGDYNHDIASSNGLFPTMQKRPDWVSDFDESSLPEGYRIEASKDIPTCRSADMPYEEGVTYTVVVDGFIVSDNINAISVKNINTEFAYSDHNPVVLNFNLIM